MGSKETDEKRDAEGSSDEQSVWAGACPLGLGVWGAVSRGPQSTVSIEQEKPKAAGLLGESAESGDRVQISALCSLAT